MDIKLYWSNNVPLQSGKSHGYTYWLDDAEDISDEPGIYVFGKIHGKSLTAIYVGKSKNIRSRIFSHFKNSVYLMNKITELGNGKRVVIFGIIEKAKYQQIDKCLEQAEKALIEHFLMEGHPLVNIKGASIARKDRVLHTHKSWNLVPRMLYVK